MRRALLPSALGIALLAAQAAPPVATRAAAEGKPLPPPATDAMPPVELSVGLENGKATCSPAELLIPADTDVELRVVSHADRPVTLTMQGQFEKGRVLHTEGDVVHVASEKGYLIKQNGTGVIRVRSLPPGEAPFACTSTADQGEPFRGKVVLGKAQG